MRPAIVITKPFISILVCVMCIPGLWAEPGETARQLAGELQGQGWTYQFRGKAAQKKIDCTQFVARVVAKEIGRPLTPSELDAINILAFTEDTVQPVLDQGTDPRVDGVVYALVTLIQKASQIEPRHARPGDFVQYWMKGRDERWWGHCGVIASVTASGYAKLYGAHASPTPDGLLGISTQAINLRGQNRRVAVARIE